MSFLIDTNIILRLAQPEHPMCSEALNALSVLRQREENSYWDLNKFQAQTRPKLAL